MAKKERYSEEEQLMIDTARNRSPAHGAIAKLTVNLEKTVERFSRQSAKQTDQMIKLTESIKWLTLVVICVMLIQIVLAI